MALTEQERKIAKNYAAKGATFMFIPSQHLVNLIVQGHPHTSNINNSLIPFILEKAAIKIETDMVLQYCDNKLDVNNRWLLDQGDIKVVPEKVSLDLNKGE